MGKLSTKSLNNHEIRIFGIFPKFGCREELCAAELVGSDFANGDTGSGYTATDVYLWYVAWSRPSGLPLGMLAPSRPSRSTWARP